MPFLTVRMYAVSVRAGQVLQRIVSRKERKRYSVLLAAANGGRRGIAYVLLKGGTGNIVRTMSSYKILPEKEKAKFTITLSTGGTIEGTYNRKKDAYSFKGL